MVEINFYGAGTALTLDTNYCKSFTELLHIKNMSSKYWRNNFFSLIKGYMCFFIKMFFMPGILFFLLHYFICKKFEPSNIKLLSVSTNFRKLVDNKQINQKYISNFKFHVVIKYTS